MRSIITVLLQLFTRRFRSRIFKLAVLLIGFVLLGLGTIAWVLARPASSESKLVTFEGTLSTEMKSIPPKGDLYNPSWSFQIDNCPYSFEIEQHSYNIFDDSLFMTSEGKTPYLIVKVPKKKLAQLEKITSDRKDTLFLGVRHLESKDHLYFNLNDYNRQLKNARSGIYAVLFALSLFLIFWGIFMKTK